MKKIPLFTLIILLLFGCKKPQQPIEGGLIISIQKGNTGVWSMIDIWDTQGHEMTIEPATAMSGYAMDKVLNHNVPATAQAANAYYKNKATQWNLFNIRSYFTYAARPISLFLQNIYR